MMHRQLGVSAVVSGGEHCGVALNTGRLQMPTVRSAAFFTLVPALACRPPCPLLAPRLLTLCAAHPSPQSPSGCTMPTMTGL